MTTYASCTPTDALNQHDTYRLTFTAGGGFLSAFLPNSSLSDTLNAAMQNVFGAGTIDGLLTFVNALNANPYQPGDLAETVDFLVTAPGGYVSDMLNNILNTANDFSLWSSTDLSSVAISACQKIVGTAAVPSGSPAAEAAAYSPAASSARATTAATASAAQASATNWLTNLESDLGTVGKYAVVGGGILALILFLPEIKAAFRGLKKVV